MAQVNGRQMEIPQPISARQLAERLDIRATRLAVELDGRLLSTDEHRQQLIGNDSVVEIVTLVGGG